MVSVSGNPDLSLAAGCLQGLPAHHAGHALGVSRLLQQLLQLCLCALSSVALHPLRHPETDKEL
jgi:hypothetical protein